MRFSARKLGFAFLVLGLVLGGCEKKQDGVVPATSEEEEKESFLLTASAKDRPVGWTKVSHFRALGSDLPTKVKVGAREVEGVTTTSGEHQEVLQVLGPNKRRRTLQVETNRMDTTIGGLSMLPEITKGVLVGKHVIEEKVDGKWTVRFESGEAPNVEEQAALDELLEELQNPTRQLGSISRAVGDEWEEDAGIFGEGRIHYRFDRLQSYQGQECGVFLGTLESVEKSPDGGETKISGKVRTFHSLEVFEPLYREFVGTMESTVYPEVGKEVSFGGPVKLTLTSVVTVPQFH